jgi:hypothetical protein
MSFGKVVKGHVFDVNKKHLEKALKDYDNQLEIRWHTDKNRGRGCWELWRRPSQMTLIPRAAGFFELRYVYKPMIHHVMDVEFLSYNIITKLKEMDAWQHADYDQALIDQSREIERKTRAAAKEELRYGLKHNRRFVTAFKDAVASGYNPGAFFFGNYDDKDK